MDSTGFKTGRMTVSQFDLRSRLKRQYLTFAGKSSKDFLLYLSGPGVYNSPEVDMELTTVPGKNGDVISENAKKGQRRYKNLDITYDAFFFNGVPAKTQAVKAWLLSPAGYQKLQDTYEPDFFRMATCKSAIDFDVTKNHKAASMELVFHCQPQKWSVEGQRAVHLSAPSSIRNPFDFYAKPLLRVYGTGEGTVYVGDTAIVIYSFSGGYVDLDCETHNAYNASGFCNGSIKSGDFPTLAPGKTAISWKGGITGVDVTPRWWTL